jgi:peptide/nickel transport system substrate-binding protein
MEKVKSSLLVVFAAVGLLALIACAGGGEGTAASAPADSGAAPATAAQPSTSTTTATMAEPASAAPAMAEPKPGGSATYVIRSDPPGWDVYGKTRGWDPLRKSAEMSFNPLIVPGANLDGGCEIVWENELAESWEYLDNTTIELKLRPGVKWQNKPPLNGRELVADDVVFSFDERYKKGVAGQSFLGQKIYDRAEAVDKYTVRFHLLKPFGFMDAVHTGGGQWIVAPELAGPDGSWWEDPVKSWIGTGPFFFTEHQAGTKLSFERNPDYFKSPMPYLNGIEALIMPDTAAREAALRSGQLDIYPAAGPTVVESIKQTNPEMSIRSCLSRFQMAAVFNLGKPPYNDVRVRQAMSMAINRDAIVKTALRGQGAAVYQAHPSDPEALKLDAFPSEVRKYMEYRPEEARQLLAEAGYGDGFTANVLWTQRYTSPWPEVAESFLTMMRDVGINTEYDLKEYASYAKLRNSGNYQDVMFGWNNSYSVDLLAQGLWSEDPSARRLHIHEANDAKLDAMIQELWATVDPKKHAQLAQELQVYLAEVNYRIMSPSWTNNIVAHPKVKNLGWRASNKIYTTLFEQVWLSE